MSLAEEMLATMPLSDDSSTYSADEEPHIVINESRQAIVPNELKTIAVTGDKDIETVTFDCVRYWDGNDLSTFAIYLNYVLPDLTTGTYIPEKITTTDGDEFYHFDWHIKNNITAKSGKISFAVTAISTKPNWAGNPIVDKQWSSLPNSDCSIALGIEVSNVPSEEESSAVLAQMSAILEQIQADFDEWLKNSVVQTTGDSTTAVMSQRATTEEFDMLKARLKLYDASYGIIVTGLENTYYIAMRNSKQIDNLKSGISDQFETDSSIAYVKDVPSNAMPYAEVKKIGGMTYKDGNTLKSAKVTEVKSVGVNLFDISKAQVGYRCNNDGTIVKITGYAVSDYIEVKKNTSYYLKNVCGVAYGSAVLFDENKAVVGNKTVAPDGNTVSGVLYVGDNVNYIRVNIFVAEADINTVMVTEGSTAQPYTPYVEHTLPIPKEVRPANGINENVYDYIEWAEDGSVKKTVKCGVVDLGEQQWNKAETSEFYADIDDNIVATWEGYACLCAKYTRAEQPTVVNNGEMVLATKNQSGTAGRLFIVDNNYTDAASFKAAMSGVMLVYELATPTTEDISDLITADNLIGVEGGGTLTFENEYKYAVPSEVEYQVEV